jgi:oligoendopeptidase F
VEPEVVEALRDAVVAAYPRLSHRYYALKAKWLGLDTLQVWDRNAPLPMEDDPHRAWDEAREMVTEAYAGLRPEDGRAGRALLHQGLDRRGREGGQGPGAFAHPTVTDVHPYVMLNYLGKPRDVMTLAHELGHGVHQRAGRRSGRAAVEHAADAGRNRQRLRRDADLPQDAGGGAETDPSARCCWPARSRT